MARAVIALALASAALAGCGSSHTTTITAPATSASGPRFSAHDTNVRAGVEAAITKRITDAEVAAGNGSTFDPHTETTCIATSDSALTCQASSDGQTQPWTAIVDTGTGVYGIQPG